MPYSVCVELALTEGFSLDWLILGQGRDGIDVHAALLALINLQRKSGSSKIDFVKENPVVMAEDFATAYDRFVTLLNLETEKGRSREEAATFIGRVMTALSDVPLVRNYDLRSVSHGRRIDSQERDPLPSTIKPGPEHISLEQVKALRELVNEAADHDVALGSEVAEAVKYAKQPLLRRYSVPDYLLIPKEFGDDALEWMRGEVEKLRSGPDETGYAPWRTELYVAIHRQARKSKYSTGQLYAMASDHLGKPITTLKQLNDEELKKLHGVIVSSEH